jgi:hypothetical protein
LPGDEYRNHQRNNDASVDNQLDNSAVKRLSRLSAGERERRTDGENVPNRCYDADDQESTELVKAAVEACNHGSRNFQNDDDEQDVVDSLEHAGGKKRCGRDKANHGEENGPEGYEKEQNGENDVE